MSVKPIRKRDEQAEATRGTLLAAARRLFGRRGYPDVSVDEIVQAARVTKGALYHHFRDKQEIFRGVVEQIQREIRERLLAAAARPASASSQLRAACHAYLDACTEEGVGRIVVLDSPAVLGWEVWCKLNREYGLGFFVERLAALRGGDPAVESSAQMLLGALNVAGRVIAQAEDRAAARSEVGTTIDRLVAGLSGAAR
jgi:AcrR family transcriptional regulator